MRQKGFSRSDTSKKLACYVYITLIKSEDPMAEHYDFSDEEYAGRDSAKKRQAFEAAREKWYLDSRSSAITS